MKRVEIPRVHGSTVVYLQVRRDTSALGEGADGYTAEILVEDGG